MIQHPLDSTKVPTGVPVGLSTTDDIDQPPMLARRQTIWQRLRRDKPALVGVCLIALMMIIVCGAPLLAPHSPTTMFDTGTTDQGAPLPPGSAGFWAGTDSSGRDLFSRLMYGGQPSLIIGVGANALAVTIGVALGLLAGFFGGWIETLIMRLTDVMMAFPTFLFALAMVAILQPGIGVIIFVIAFVSWTGTCRIIHGQTLSLREQEFVEAARALGIPTWRILLRHILPHLVSPIIVYATLGVATTIVFEAGLSYLGLSVPPPTPSWGKMAADGSNQLDYPWLVMFPGLAILLTVIGFNLLGDGLRNAFDPRRPRS